ncbi:hypothetical protein [Pseudonocardia sp.]|uniref:hypothetical protein n=1 Tax=Pseudonocardia sp. TaxID=60912 RepID=UPI0031FC98CB
MTLTWGGGLVAGEQVLVLGAGGVVGQTGVQLARAAGAARVVAEAVARRLTVAYEQVPLADATHACTRHADGRPFGRIVLRPGVPEVP